MVVRAPALQGRPRGGAGAIAVADHPAVDAPAVPYRGIQPFRYEDHGIFFARGEETRLLTSLVAVYRGVFLYGASGNGKSSLVNAGLLPAAYELGLQGRARARAAACRRGARRDSTASRIGDDDEEPFLARTPRTRRGARGAFDRRFEARVRPLRGRSRPLIVFDQFEEILTLFEDKAALALRDAARRDDRRGCCATRCPSSSCSRSARTTRPGQAPARAITRSSSTRRCASGRRVGRRAADRSSAGRLSASPGTSSASLGPRAGRSG